jgi:hypothetical protein
MYLSATSALAALIAVATLTSAQEATPSAAPSASGPSNATVETFTLPSCNGAIRLGKKHRWSMAPDSCLSVSTSSSFRIEEPAICPNGTRARLARYEGRGCNGGVITAEDGLVDLGDDDLSKNNNGKCFEIRPDSVVDKKVGYASFSFFCDGRTAKGGEGDGEPAGSLDKTKKGSVSHNICPVRGDSRPRAPTFGHPLPDTCMNLPTRQPLKVLSVATCPDGSEARLATWSGRDCPGIVPGALEPVADDQIDACMLWDDSNDISYAFWCTGDIKRGDKTSEPGPDGPPGGDRKDYNIVGLILVMFLIGSVGILVFAFALLRWAAVANKVMNVVRHDGAITL